MSFGRHDSGAQIHGDIAIIGMACMFPGAPDLDAYWQNILDKVDAITDPPAAAWDVSLYYSPDSEQKDRIYCRKGGFLAPLAKFEPLQFGVMPISLDGSEPDQWLALKVANDALTDAGVLEQLSADPEMRQRTSVILGKGTYLNRGNLNMVQHSLVVDQTVQILESLHPQLNDENLQEIRQELKKTLPPFSSETAPGLVPNITAGRIANRLDLMGPAYTIDAACASSLIAVEHATYELNSGKCDLALVGGVHVSTPVPILSLFSQLGALSHREEIRPFDKRADGTILSEGIGIIILKRRADAERDGNRIYAFIKGSGSASDGRGMSVLSPRLEGEILAIERALTMAGVDAETIGLIEAHGTGTPVGDQTEIQALRAIFGERGDGPPPCALGTVKSMIGHTMPAAGMAGIIKMALALSQKVLPPTLNIDEPDPRLELDKTPFYLNTAVRPWIHGNPNRKRRAGVNAFGFGGINAHVLLEESDETVHSDLHQHMPKWDSELIVLDAPSRSQLIEKISELLEYSKSGVTVSLPNLAYTLAELSGQRYRLALIVESMTDLCEKLAIAKTRLEKQQTRQIKDIQGIYFFEEPLYPAGKVAFLFPGEGAQYPRMLADLCLHFPEVRGCFDRIDRAFVTSSRQVKPSDFIFPRSEPVPADDSNARLVERPDDTIHDQLWQIDGAIEAVLTANSALFTLLQRLGIKADAYVGHSTGEYSALLASEAIAMSEDEFVENYLVQLNRRYKEVVSETNVPEAVMAAIAAPVEQVGSLIQAVDGDVYIAMDNCPHQTVVLGEKRAMDNVMAIAQTKGLICSLLPFERGYHSELFEPYNHLFEELYHTLPLAKPQTPVYSCVTAAPFANNTDGISQLAAKNWVSRVRFRETVETMYEDGIRIFVEVGPRGNLTSFVTDILRGQPHLAIPANIQQRSGLNQLNHLLALLWTQHVPVDLLACYQRRNPRRVNLTASEQYVPQDTTVDLATGWASMNLSPDTVQRIRGALTKIEPIQDTVTIKSWQKGRQTEVETEIRGSEKITYGANGGDPLGASASHSKQTATAGQPLRQQYSMDGNPQEVQAQSGVAANYARQSALIPYQAASNDERSAIVEAHLKLMEQFLASQETIMRLYLQGEATEGKETFFHRQEAVSEQDVSIAQVPESETQDNPQTNGYPPPPVAKPASLHSQSKSASPQASPEASPLRSTPERPQSIEVTETEQLAGILVRLVSEKTGYPPDMLKLTANLEGDLGIDSIKRVEILGAFNRETGLLKAEDIEHISSLKTMQEMLDFFRNSSSTK